MPVLISGEPGQFDQRPQAGQVQGVRGGRVHEGLVGEGAPGTPAPIAPEPQCSGNREGQGEGQEVRAVRGSCQTAI